MEKVGVCVAWEAMLVFILSAADRLQMKDHGPVLL